MRDDGAINTVVREDHPVCTRRAAVVEATLEDGELVVGRFASAPQFKTFVIIVRVRVAVAPDRIVDQRESMRYSAFNGREAVSVATASDGTGWPCTSRRSGNREDQEGEEKQKRSLKHG